MVVVVVVVVAVAAAAAAVGAVVTSLWRHWVRVQDPGSILSK